jgi:hypothetical protein
VEELGAPLGPWHLHPNPCSPVADHRDIRTDSGGPIRLHGLGPGSVVCFQTFMGPWSTWRANSKGRVTIPFKGKAVAGLGGWRHVLYRAGNGSWVWMSLAPEWEAAPAELTILQAWLGLRAWTLGAGLLLIFLCAGALEMWIRRRYHPTA